MQVVYAAEAELREETAKVATLDAVITVHKDGRVVLASANQTMDDRIGVRLCPGQAALLTGTRIAHIDDDKIVRCHEFIDFVDGNILVAQCSCCPLVRLNDREQTPFQYA